MIHVMWWNRWIGCIKAAKMYPDRNEHLCRQAALAQAEYVMLRAIYTTEVQR